MDEEFRSPSPPCGYGVDITGSCPLGRENFGPTTRTPCRNVSLSSQVIPMSWHIRFHPHLVHQPASPDGVLQLVLVGHACVAAGDEPYSFTIVVRSARALSLNKFSVHNYWYALCIRAVSLDTAAIAPFNVFTMVAMSQSETCWTLSGDDGVITTSCTLGGT